MKILVTGSNGLVGHAILESLNKTQHQILTPSHAELDLLDKSAINSYLRQNQPDFVIHSAGTVGGIMVNRKENMKYMLDNLDMGRNLIHESFLNGVKKLINLGSSCMYPRNSEKPLTEDMVLTGELEPTNEGYALAKSMCAKLCQYISRENPEFHYKTLIPCNLYGKYDKFKTENAHMLPQVIHRIHTAKIENQPTMSIWGSGNARREFLFSSDLGDLIAYCVENFDTMPEILNAGTGIDYTINYYYEIVAEIVGYTGKFEHDLSKPEGMYRKLTDVTRLKNFGWTAKTDLKSGIKQTYDFYLQNVK